MINITYKSVRKTFYEKTKYFSSVIDTKSPSLFQQIKERDNCIKEMVKNLPYVEGELVTPHSEAERELRGKILIVEKICDSYAKYGKNENWPENNNPMVITVYNMDTKVRFICTPKYVVPINADGTPKEST